MRADRCLRLRRGAATCRSRSPDWRRGSPTTRSLRAWPSGRRRGTRDERRGNPPATAPTRNSCQASDPAVSAFVGASAGSGKTKLLTDRLLRLMLAGAAPERIQCLTFTKAAAAEMAVRLQKTLGRWVTLDDAALARELQALRCRTVGRRRWPRRGRLFARVLDLPGGMRIGTIHAFCQSLLRRFPLEAALSPHFRLVDDRDAEDALTEAREDMLAHASTPRMRAALVTLAGLASADQFGRHVATLQARSAAAAGGTRARRRRWRTRSAARSASPPATEDGDHRARGELAGGAHAARGGADRAAARRDEVRRTRGTHPRLARPGRRGARRALAALVRGVPDQGGRAARGERVRVQGGDRRASRPGAAISSTSATASSRRSTHVRHCASPRCRPRW